MPSLYGQLAVAVFIVGSGVSIGLSSVRDRRALRHGTATFLLRRGWRILPPCRTALALSVDLGLVADHSIYPRSIAVDAALVQDVLSNRSPNGSCWSIEVEFQVYLVLPVLLLLARRVTFGVVVAGLLLLLPPLRQHVGAVSHLSPQFLLLFVFGVLAVPRASAKATSRRKRRVRTAVVALGAAGLLWFVAAAHTPWVVLHYFWVDVTFGAWVALLCRVGLSHDGSPRGDVRGVGPRRPSLLTKRPPVALRNTVTVCTCYMHQS